MHEMVSNKSNKWQVKYSHVGWSCWQAHKPYQQDQSTQLRGRSGA